MANNNFKFNNLHSYPIFYRKSYQIYSDQDTLFEIEFVRQNQNYYFLIQQYTYHRRDQSFYSKVAFCFENKSWQRFLNQAHRITKCAYHHMKGI